MKRPVPIPASSGERKGRGEAVDEPDADERGAAQEVREHDAATARPPVRCGTKDRAEQHRGHEVGKQHQAERPRRVEPLVGNEEERDVCGAIPERRLRERGEEQAGARARAAVGETSLTAADSRAGPR